MHAASGHAGGTKQRVGIGGGDFGAEFVSQLLQTVGGAPAAA